MTKYCLKPAILLTIIFCLPIFVMRALPYDDRAIRVLIQENCSAPCFMGIRPGLTTMREAVYILDSHAWVASRIDDFPSQVQDAIFFDAAVPRIFIEWQWSADLPEWINDTQRSGLMVEDREVQDMSIQTHLSLGEIVLAFGDPDESRFITSNTPSGRRFEYTSWYASEGMLVSIEGLCPTQHYYSFPVRILFRTASPGLSDSVSKAFICR